jgi:hypothetical protein
MDATRNPKTPTDYQIRLQPGTKEATDFRPVREAARPEMRESEGDRADRELYEQIVE